MASDGTQQRDLPKAGDECGSCRKFWASQHLAPRLLVAVDKKVTEQRHIEVIVCPYCDGAAILRLNACDE